MSGMIFVLFGGYALLNLCIMGWFWLMLRGNRGLQCLSTVVFLALSILFPIFYKSLANEAWQFTLLFIGALWIGAFVYVFLLIFVAELIGRFRRKTGQSSRSGFSSWSGCSKPVRFLVCGCVTGLSLLITATSYWINANPVLNQQDLRVVVDDPAALDLPNNTLTVAVISDVHLGRLVPASRLEKLFNLAKPYKPDAVFLVGDILDDHIRLDIPAMRKAVENMAAPFGVWVVLGNHEYYSSEGNIQTSIDLLKASGMHLLRDEWAVLGGKILLVGRDDYSDRRFSSSPQASLEGLLNSVPKEQRHLPMIVLDHQPRHLEEAQKVGAQLQLSGHTHKGQIWPFSLVVNWMYENPAGHSMRGDTHYFVTVGGGTWGPPMRNTARPEVVLLRLHFVKKAGSILVN